MPHQPVPGDLQYLELIAWRCAPADTEVTRVSDSGSQAGSIGEVALSVIGRTAITAVRNGSGNLFMILWDVPLGLGSITRTWDSGTTAGEASRIAMALQRRHRGSQRRRQS
jgi:hypothetical protein